MKILLVCCLIGLGYGNNTIADKNNAALYKLVKTVNEHNGKISEWTLHTRDHVSREKVDKTAKELRKYFSHWTWAISKVKEREVLSASISEQGITQNIQLVSDNTGEPVSFLIYTVKGVGDKDMNEFVDSIFMKNLSLIFNNTPPIFSCIKGVFDGTLEEVLPNQIASLLSEWNAKELESIKEHNFYSISAFSDEFEDTVPLENQQMNLQIGLRTNGLGTETTFVIGTPIITIEY